MLSPRSALISRLIAERDAARAQEATPGTSRTLTFEEPTWAAGAAASWGGADRRRDRRREHRSRHARDWGRWART
eukprot:1771430-Pleurochrysis_carterae.AAC.1